MTWRDQCDLKNEEVEATVVVIEGGTDWAWMASILP
jgi:hypothetical protein